jgi:acyl carrier protein
MSAREEVRNYLVKVLRESKDDTVGFGDGDSLVVTGRLSSLDVVDVLTFLERTFAFEMDPNEFDLERFDSVDRVMSMLGKSGVAVA